MQSLVANYPELIGDADGSLLLVRREQPIADAADAAGRWSLDHLFVTRSARPVLVELKRAVDTRLRREVVGQMLDYAANSVAYWRAGTIAGAFAATCEAASLDPDETLATFLDDNDPAVFWDQVDANFQAGHIKLVFVADVIPRELARIVEFLNEQMREADVCAVELKWYDSEAGVTTLVPRIIGETERAAAQKSATHKALPPISMDDWIEQHIRPLGEESASGAQAFISLVRELGGEPMVSKEQASILGVFRTKPGASVYPMRLLRDGRLSVSFRNLTERPGLADESTRRSIYDMFVKAAGTLSTENLSGSPSFKVSLLTLPVTRTALTAAARELIALALA